MNHFKHFALLVLFLAFEALFIPALAQNSGDTIKVQLKNESAINTTGFDFSPTFYEDGIVFISTNSVGMEKLTDDELNMSAMSILRAQRMEEGELGPPGPFARELTNPYHQGPVCFDRTGETVYFSTNSVEKGKEKRARDKGLKQRLYFALKNGTGWSEPVPLPFNKGEWDDMHPAISIDGDKLYFASNRPGGLGSTDIYVSYRIGNSWSEPVNLGAGVNTPGREAFPFLHADNTLYYASDAIQGGKGGLDLFFVRPSGSEWTKPIPIDTPFNTAGDDFGLIVDLNKINGYFSSNGQSGAAGDDIFSFHMENGNLDDYLLNKELKNNANRLLDLAIMVVDRQTRLPINDATVQLIDENSTNAIGRDEAGNLIGIQKINGQEVIGTIQPGSISGNTDNSGRYQTTLRSGNYLLRVNRRGYNSKQMQIPLVKTGNEIMISMDRPGNIADKTQWNAAVFNYVTNAPMAGTTMILTNRTTGKRDTIITDAGGLTDNYLDRNSKYDVSLYQGGRLIGTTEIETSSSGTMLQNISVAPLLPGTVIELPNIYYNFNDASLRPDARKDLNLVAALLKQHQGIKVELASHTDSRGTEPYNRDLSQRRANGVVEYLSTRGIGRDRLVPVGYGESQPRNGCIDNVPCEEPEYARNRRTEIRIITGVQGATVIYVDGQVSGTSPTAETAANTNNNGQVVVPALPPAKKPSRKPTRSSAPPSLEYHVIAGSFLMENRAHNQVNTVSAAGFSAAKVIQYPNSPFFSVNVGNFNTRSDAQELERQLKQAKIDAFIRAVPLEQ